MYSDIQQYAILVEPQSEAGELVCCFAPLRIEDWEADGLAPMAFGVVTKPFLRSCREEF
jgi:hypothetical protein